MRDRQTNLADEVRRNIEISNKLQRLNFHSGLEATDETTKKMQVELVEKECGRYFENYTNCVNTFPNTWHLDCEKQKVKLARCAESNPTIVKIRSGCAESFAKYEACVGQHPTQFELCSKEFAVFHKCAQKIEAITEGLEVKVNSKVAKCHGS